MASLCANEEVAAGTDSDVVGILITEPVNLIAFVLSDHIRL